MKITYFFDGGSKRPAQSVVILYDEFDASEP